jgi:hypothetical protein
MVYVFIARVWPTLPTTGRVGSVLYLIFSFAEMLPPAGMPPVDSLFGGLVVVLLATYMPVFQAGFRLSFSETSDLGRR